MGMPEGRPAHENGDPAGGRPTRRFSGPYGTLRASFHREPPGRGPQDPPRWTYLIPMDHRRCVPAGISPANKTINPFRVRGAERVRVDQVSQEASDGRIRQPSWGRLGLEVVTDLVGWLVVFAVLQLIGTAALQRITGPTLIWELLLILILFFAVTVVVRVGFILIARRTVQ